MEKKEALNLTEKWATWHRKKGHGSKEWQKEFGDRHIKLEDLAKSFILYIYNQARGLEIKDKRYEKIKCYICKKKIDVDEVEEVYFINHGRILIYICSENCDKKCRIKFTDQKSGITMTPYAFEHPIRIKETEPMKPLLKNEEVIGGAELIVALSEKKKNKKISAEK